MAEITATENPSERRTDFILRVSDAELVLALDRYSNVVLDRLVDRVVGVVFESAAVQARIAAIRQALPLRIEEAVAAALTAAVLAPVTKPSAD